MILNEAEIERRKPVWATLSELWLDTELTDNDLQKIAGVMKWSGYSVSQMRHINLFAVAPNVIPKLLSVAGIWPDLPQDRLYRLLHRHGLNRCAVRG
jgi:hypothetical protein